MNKVYITPQQLLTDAFTLAWQVFESGFRPHYIVGVWRGGTPIGIAVHELLHVLGVGADHFAVRTSSYAGMGQHKGTVQVEGLDYITRRLRKDDTLLLVDDVHDTGLSLRQIISDLREASEAAADIRIATPYFKPGSNRTGQRPDYFLHETDEWLVFPHELEGLTVEEMRENKPELAALLPMLAGRLRK